MGVQPMGPLVPISAERLQRCHVPGYTRGRGCAGVNSCFSPFPRVKSTITNLDGLSLEATEMVKASAVRDEDL